MIDKILDFLSKHWFISTIAMVFIVVVLFITYLIIKITLAKSGNIWDWVSWISDIVTIWAIPAIAYQIKKLNKSFREKFLWWEKDENEETK